MDEILDGATLGLGLTLNEAKKLVQADNRRLKDLLEASFKLTKTKTGGSIYFYEKAFPPISLTGYSCELNCQHCGGYYLQHMIPIQTPSELVKTCGILYRQGVRGVLLSGGSRKDGTVPLDCFLDAIKTVKKDFGMFIEAHTGPISKETSKLLVEAGLDAALPDVVGDAETTRKVYGLKITPKKYELMLAGMKEAGMKNISPHICVGLNFGRLKGEVKALQIVSKFNPTIIVITVFIPTPKTPMGETPQPKPEDVAKIIAVANLMFPKTPVSLGCVRPGGTHRDHVDRLAVMAGVAKIAVPSKAAFKEAEKLGLRINTFSNHTCCCASEMFMD